MNWKNSVSQKLNIAYPIIQAPMFGVTTPEMVAAAARANALGTLALGDLSAEKSREIIRATKKLTDKTFAVNIFVNPIPEISAALRSQYSRAKSYMENLAKQHQLDVSLPNIEEIKLTDYHEQIDAIIAEQCKILSFTFGNLDAPSIRKLKDNNTVLIGSCTSVKEAETLAQSGIDLICVQGFEAGGHRGSFANEDIPQIGGMSLLPQIRDKVKTPLIYAGGIYDAKTLLAAETLGAQGFQLGSLLLCSAESALRKFEKQRLQNISEADIVLTKSFSGRYARGIKNAFVTAMENTENILPYPYQNKLTNELRNAAKSANNTDFVSIWVGQSVHLFSENSTEEIIGALVREVEETGR